MYAVIETGGKQYQATLGEVIQIEKLEGEVGGTIHFDKVLFCSNSTLADMEAGEEKPSAANDQALEIWVGKPYLNAAKVSAEIIGQGRGDKILIVKMKRRKQYRRTQGHRQDYTQVLITSLNNGSGKTLELDAAAKQAKISKFQSHLKPKGLAFSPKKVTVRRPLVKKAEKASATQ